VPEAWRDTVKSQLKPLVRALYSAGEFTTEVDGVWQFSVPNEAHGAKCAEHQAAVEAALTAAVGAPVSIAFIAGGSTVSTKRPDRSAAPAPRRDTEPSSTPDAPRESAMERATRAAATEAEPDPEPAPYVPDDDDEIDLTELTDAPPEAVKTPIERLADAFPGSELIADERD
jgi:DNA polymerase-3 subunit gamma/tau